MLFQHIPYHACIFTIQHVVARSAVCSLPTVSASHYAVGTCEHSGRACSSQPTPFSILPPPTSCYTQSGVKKNRHSRDIPQSILRSRSRSYYGRYVCHNRRIDLRSAKSVGSSHLERPRSTRGQDLERSPEKVVDRNRVLRSEISKRSHDFERGHLKKQSR